MPELLRPEPPRSWRDRLEALWATFRDLPHGVIAGASGAAIGGVVAAVVATTFLRPPAPPPEVTLPRATDVADPTTEPTEVVVHVTGAVHRPGVHTLATGARVADALEAAGGATPDADVDRLNLARPLSDGERVYVVRKGEPDPPEIGATGSSGGSGESGPLDLNRASADELDELPGIGPATADAIVQHRQRHGRFRSVDDLLEVRGIGPAKLEQLRSLVRV